MKLALILAGIVTLETVATAAPTAEDLYAEGKIAYDRADYATAITRWQASYQLSGANGLIFNLAQALRLSGACSDAIVAYDQFLAADSMNPTSEQHKIAEDFTRDLKLTCVTATVAPVPLKPTRAYTTRTLKITGLVTSGAGAASIVGGLLLGHHASQLGDGITQACMSSCDWSMQKSDDATGRRDAVIGYGLDVAGAAALVGGAILYYVGDHRRSITLVPMPREDGAVVSWSGSW